MTSQIGVAIIGCGYWGVNYVRVFDELPRARIVTICDQRVERLREISERFNGIAVTTDLDDALQMDGVDVAIVCTGATTHYAVTRECLEAGKHVLVEKPMATDVADSKMLIQVAEENNVVLMVGHTFLYNSAIAKIEDHLKKPESGGIYYLYSRRTNMGPIRHDVNALWDLAPHDVSIFNHLVGESPTWVSAVGVCALRGKNEDAGFVSLGYPSGVVANIHVSWVDPNKVRELVIVCSDKRIVFDDLNALERVKIFEKGVAPTPNEASSYGEHQFLIRDGDIFSPKVQISEPLKNQCNHLIDCIESGKTPLTDGQAGLEVVRVMAGIDRSMQQNGTPVLLESLDEQHNITTNTISNAVAA